MDKAEAADTSLSLREKLSRHVHRRMRRKRKLRYNPVWVNRLAPWSVLAMCLSGMLAVVPGIMPVLYQDVLTLRIMQVIGCHSLVQLFIHWYLTRHTDSEFTAQPSEGDHDSFERTPSNTLGSPISMTQTHFVDLSGLYQDNPEAKMNIPDFQLLNIPQASRSSSRVGADRKRRNGYHTGLSFWVPVSKRPEDSLSQKTGDLAELDTADYPYWGWAPCFICQRSRPPRCHHCPLCKKCILKRDHHCFFTGVCIGVNNQKHFLVFMFWAIFATTFGLSHMYVYVCTELAPFMSFMDFTPPFCFIRVLQGHEHYITLLLCLTFWSLNFFTLFSSIIFYQITCVTLEGATLFEKEHCIKVKDARSRRQRLREILGENWMLNFILPYRRSVRYREDAIYWPSINPE